MANITLTKHALLGLFFIHKYRFLTTAQYAKVTELSRNVASSNLRRMERLNWLGHIGNTPIAGQGKTPKTYYLKPKGYEALLAHSGRSEEELGSFVKAHTGINWSPIMYHRIDTVSVLMQMHLETRRTPDLRLIGTRLEYVRKKVGSKLQAETTDTYQGHQSKIVRIVPDGAFAIENVSTGGRALFFLELDRDTEPITSSGLRNSIIGKFQKYDGYMQSLKFRETYKEWGNFQNFVCLFVTPEGKGTPPHRLDNIRTASRGVGQGFDKFYRLGTFESACEHFYNDRWRSRDADDKTGYRLVRAR